MSIKLRQLKVLLPIVTLIWIGVLQAFPGSVSAEEVKARFNNLTVNANIELADGKRLENGIILIAHALIQHNRIEIIQTLQDLFKEHGHSTIAINYSLNFRTCY